MSFGKRIKALRRNKDMTQEQLAEMLSVSPQAVSRWETDTAMPDISLIPAICNLFDTSADHLLGIDSENKKKRISYIDDRFNSLADRGYYREAREVLEEGLKEYPNSFLLICDLMFLSFWQYCRKSEYTKEEIDCFRDQAITLGERILESCTDDSFRHSAIQTLCFLYPDVGNPERALELAMTASNMANCQEFLLVNIYRGNEQYEAWQRKVFNLIQFLAHELEYPHLKNDSGEPIYTASDVAVIRDKLIDILHIVFEDGNYGFYHAVLSSCNKSQARYYAKIQNAEKALSHLQAASEHAVGFVKYLKAADQYTSLLFRGYGSGRTSVSDSNNDALRLMKEMKRSEYDFIRDNAQFTAIGERMEKYARKWEIDS